MKFFMRPFKLALRGMAIFLLFIAIWLGPVALAAAPPSVAKQSLQEVSEGLTCQCGCGLTVANCNHPTCNFAVPLRVEIEGLLSKGMGRVVILASFRHKYGEKILSAPTTEGFNILAWIMPFAAVAGGGLLIVLAIGRWKRGPPSTPTEQPASLESEQTDDRLRRQLEQDIARRL